ncbi:MAG: Pilus assembly protein PilP [Pseudomonadota bacterium]|jgi:hypothetical protein
MMKRTKTCRKYLTLLIATSSSLICSYTYRPEGKIDPFAPLSLIRPTLSGATRLQQHDISEFELVGTLFGKEPTALLMTPDPKQGVIARVGDRIGRHGGRVVSITRDRVLTREPSANSVPGQAVQFNDIAILLSKYRQPEALKELKK